MQLHRFFMPVPAFNYLSLGEVCVISEESVESLAVDAVGFELLEELNELLVARLPN